MSRLLRPALVVVALLSSTHVCAQAPTPRVAVTPPAPTAGLPSVPNGGDSSVSIAVAPYAVFLGGAALDLTSTLVALQNPALKEGNPLLGTSMASLVGIKVGGTAAVALAMRHMTQRGHPKLAKVIGYSFGVWWTGLAANNARLATKYRGGR